MTDFHERRIHSAFGDLGGRTLKSVRGAECGVRLNTEILSAVQEHCPPENHSLFATRYSLLTTRCRFGFNWRVVLPHDRKLDEFGCSGEQPSSFVPARPKFFGTAEPCPPEKPSATRHSLFATRCRFGLAGASPSQFIPSLVPRPTPRFKLVAMVTKPAIWVARCGLRV